MIYVLMLLVVTAVWGWTFVLVKDAVTQYPTLPFLQIRFGLALVVMALVVHRLPTRRELRVGAVLAAGHLTQTAGLTITSPGNAGLITRLFVVLTPCWRVSASVWSRPSVRRSCWRHSWAMNWHP